MTLAQHLLIIEDQALHLNRLFSLADLKVISKEGQMLLSLLWC